MSTGRRQLADAIVRLGLTRIQALKAVNAILELLHGRLAGGSPVSLQGFGSFQHHENHRSRMFDPRTRTERGVRATTLVRFRPSHELQRALRRPRDE